MRMLAFVAVLVCAPIAAGAQPPSARECDSIARPLTAAPVEPCTPPVRTRAQPGPQAPTGQAERFLRSCEGLSGNDAEWCQVDRRTFSAALPRAYRGEYHAQRNVAFLLRGSAPGVAPNHIEACAWRLLIVAQGHAEADASDTANVRFDCGRLGAQDQAVARQRAMALATQVDPPTPRR